MLDPGFESHQYLSASMWIETAAMLAAKRSHHCESEESAVHK